MSLGARGTGAWLVFRREKVPGTAPIAFTQEWFPLAPAFWLASGSQRRPVGGLLR
jgi:hypothetical protein